jgi:hypothetical protein
MIRILDQWNRGNDTLRENEGPNSQIHLLENELSESTGNMTKQKHTIDAPKFSHFTNDLGNTGKSTARMASTVISIICALYVVKADNGASLVDDVVE